MIKMKTIRMDEMTWVDIKTAMEEGYDTVVIGVGSIEQHGPHLPTQTDALLGDTITNQVASKRPKTLQGPTIRIGCSEHHMAFPGTITLTKETLKRVITDYTRSLVRHGFSKIFFIPSHGGNFAPLNEVLNELQKEFSDSNINGLTNLQKFIKVLQKSSEEEGITAEEAGAHAGESETSLVLAIKEQLVKKEHFETGYVGPFGKEQSDLIFSKGMTALTKNGILGDSTKASKEKGQKYLARVVDYVVEEMNELL
jgi:creatinine amidohydrolase